MKKRFLSLFLLVPLFGLAACSSGEASKAQYKKCSYFNLDGKVLVSEDGYTINGVIVAKYALSDADADEVSNYFANFPSEIAVLKSYQEVPLPIEQEHKPDESVNLNIDLGGGIYKNYTLMLDEESVSLYDSYTECYYSEASNTGKFIEHNFVKRPGGIDYQTAYINTGSIVVSCKEVEYPTEKYKFENIEYPIIEQTLERYLHIGEDIIVAYAFAE